MRAALRRLRARLAGRVPEIVIGTLVLAMLAFLWLAIAGIDRNISKCLSSRCSVGRSPTYAEGRCICVEHAEGR